VIFASTLAFICESEVCSSSDCINGLLPFEPWAEFFYWCEWIAVVIFTVEYMLRFATCADTAIGHARFVFGTMNMIDLAAWLPFWIGGFMSMPVFAKPVIDDAGGGGASFMRAVRLVRVFRVFKSGRYQLGLKIFSDALKLSVMPMIILSVCASCYVVVVSSVIYMVERVEGDFVTDELLLITGRQRPTMDNRTVKGMQDWCYGTIPASAWWVLTTMTTVGYGDCSPITLSGKLFGVLTMGAGVIFLALPITVLGSNFAKTTEMYEEDAARFSLQDYNVDGIIDEFEVREFLLRTKREGLLRKDVDTSVDALFTMFDPETRGYLDMDTFKRLRTHVVAESKDPIANQFDVTNRKIDDVRRMVQQHLEGGRGVTSSPAARRPGQGLSDVVRSAQLPAAAPLPPSPGAAAGAAPATTFCV